MGKKKSAGAIKKEGIGLVRLRTSRKGEPRLPKLNASLGDKSDEKKGEIQETEWREK